MIEKIKEISKEIMEEVNGAKKYYRCSMEWQSSNSDISKMYSEMASQELTHAKHLIEILKEMSKDGVSAEEKVLINFIEEIGFEQIAEAKIG